MHSGIIEPGRLSTESNDQAPPDGASELRDWASPSSGSPSEKTKRIRLVVGPRPGAKQGDQKDKEDQVNEVNQVGKGDQENKWDQEDGEDQEMTDRSSNAPSFLRSLTVEQVTDHNRGTDSRVRDTRRPAEKKIVVWRTKNKPVLGSYKEGQNVQVNAYDQLVKEVIEPLRTLDTVAEVFSYLKCGLAIINTEYRKGHHLQSINSKTQEGQALSTQVSAQTAKQADALKGQFSLEQ